MLFFAGIPMYLSMVVIGLISEPIATLFAIGFGMAIVWLISLWVSGLERARDASGAAGCLRAILVLSLLIAAFPASNAVINLDGTALVDQARVQVLFFAVPLLLTALTVSAISGHLRAGRNPLLAVGGPLICLQLQLMVCGGIMFSVHLANGGSPI